MNLVLASSSPRRAELLDRLDLVFDVAPADIDERRRPGEGAGDYVDRLAREKAQRGRGPATVAIGADTAIVHEGHVLGKPAHPEEARGMLRRLQGDSHEVFTGLAVALGDRVESVVDVTEVHFMEMTDMEIADYVDSGEPMGKAGAYALQGRGGLFVERVVGSPFTVIGMPIHLLPRLLRRVGAALDEFHRGSNL